MSTDTTKPVVSPAARRSLKSSSGAVSTPLSVTLGRYSAIILWAGFTILFGILRPDTFLSSVTWRLTFSEGVVTAIVALARKLLVALWKYVTSGVMIEGAAMKPSTSRRREEPIVWTTKSAMNFWPTSAWKSRA